MMAYAPGVNLGPPIELVTPIVIGTIDPASTPTTTTVTVVGLPGGTKAVAGWFQAVASAVGHYVSMREFGTSVNRSRTATLIAGEPSCQWFCVRVDSSFRFDVYSANAAISAVDITITEYYTGG
jgi:hypothetical protein